MAGDSDIYYNRIDQFVVRNERRWNRWWWMVIVAVGLLVAAAIYVRPEGGYVGAGVSYEQLARNPFDFSTGNRLAFRIMTPLISYLIGLPGKLFIITNLIITVIFIGIVYDYFRKTAPRPGDAFMAAVVLTFSTAILVNVGQSGWCDVLTYLAVFGMWRWRRNVWLYALFFILAVFNHERVLFLLPWLVLVRIQGSDRKFRAAVVTTAVIVVGLALYFLFRRHISGEAPPVYTLAYYFQPMLKHPLGWLAKPLAYLWLGLLTVFKLLWIVPVMAWYGLRKEGRKREALMLILPMVLASFQLIIAWDTTRMFTLGFMTIILALDYLFKSDRVNIRKWLPGLIILTLFIPQLYTASNIAVIMPSTPVNLLRMLIGGGGW